MSWKIKTALFSCIGKEITALMIAWMLLQQSDVKSPSDKTATDFVNDVVFEVLCLINFACIRNHNWWVCYWQILLISAWHCFFFFTSYLDMHYMGFFNFFKLLVVFVTLLVYLLIRVNNEEIYAAKTQLLNHMTWNRALTTAVVGDFKLFLKFFVNIRCFVCLFACFFVCLLLRILIIIDMRFGNMRLLLCLS